MTYWSYYRSPPERTSSLWTCYVSHKDCIPPCPFIWYSRLKRLSWRHERPKSAKTTPNFEPFSTAPQQLTVSSSSAGLDRLYSYTIKYQLSSAQLCILLLLLWSSRSKVQHQTCDAFQQPATRKPIFVKQPHLWQLKPQQFQKPNCESTVISSLIILSTPNPFSIF